MFKSAAKFGLFLCITNQVVFAQSGFFKSWEDRVRATSARQPAWPVPVVAPSAVIVQLARIDFVHQYTSTHTETWNYDNGKGVNFIPFARTEIDINLLPYIQHNSRTVQDGAGDLSLVAKYRMFAANEGGTIRQRCRWRSLFLREVTRTVRRCRRLRLRWSVVRASANSISSRRWVAYCRLARPTR